MPADVLHFGKPTIRGVEFCTAARKMTRARCILLAGWRIQHVLPRRAGRCVKVPRPRGIRVDTHATIVEFVQHVVWPWNLECAPV
eukprot:914104-Prymnesium_polylepis.2